MENEIKAKTFELLMILVHIIFPIVLVVAVTYAAVYFNNLWLLFWYVVPAFCYLGKV